MKLPLFRYSVLWHCVVVQSGELVRTSSQEQIIKDITELREKRERKRSTDHDKDKVLFFALHHQIR